MGRRSFETPPLIPHPIVTVHLAAFMGYGPLTTKSPSFRLVKMITPLSKNG